VAIPTMVVFDFRIFFEFSDKIGIHAWGGAPEGTSVSDGRNGSGGSGGGGGCAVELPRRFSTDLA